MPSIIREAQLARLTSGQINKKIDKLLPKRNENEDDLNRWTRHLNRMTEDDKKIKLRQIYTEPSMRYLTNDIVVCAVKVPKLNAEKFATCDDHKVLIEGAKKMIKKYERLVKFYDRYLDEYTDSLANRM